MWGARGPCRPRSTGTGRQGKNGWLDSCGRDRSVSVGEGYFGAGGVNFSFVLSHSFPSEGTIGLDHSVDISNDFV